jgi:hypothetical protein
VTPSPSYYGSGEKDQVRTNASEDKAGDRKMAIADRYHFHKSERKPWVHGCKER